VKLGRTDHVDKTAEPVEENVNAIDAAQLDELSSAFAAPKWLRDLGRTSWYLLGTIVLVGLIGWGAGHAATIVMPVAAAFIVAVVASPVVGLLQRHRFPRAAAAFVVLLVLIAVGVVVALLVIGGITAQSGTISSEANAAADKVQSWVKSTGVDTSGASKANASVKSSVPSIISTFVHGIANGIRGITSLAFFVSFAAFALFFLLKDGPKFRAWLERHLGVPAPVAGTIVGDVLTSVRRYFTGVTIVAAFNGVVVGVGAWLLGVPLAGTIAVVTFVTAYVPFIGAFVAGAFAVVLALGSKGTSTAIIMLVIVLLANGLLQNIVQPIAFGATLDLNPLVVLIVTISAGCFFGMLGLVLAAPLTSAVVHISADLARARAAARAALPSGEPTPAPT
jgi:predicted PurR-regulated permease PerM